MSSETELVVRDMTAADIDAVAALTARVFSRADERDATASIIGAAFRSTPRMPISHCLLAVRGDQIVGKWQALDLAVRLGDTTIRTAGLHTVLVAPEADGEGLVWRMIPAGLARLGELGHCLAIGFAAQGGAYTTFGARPIAADYTWSADAWSIPPGNAAALRPATEADVPAIVAASNRAQGQRSASLVRAVEDWPWYVRKPPELFVSERGYLGLRASDEALEVREAAGTPDFYGAALRWLSAEARRRCLRTLRGHLPTDHPLVRASLPYGAAITVEHPRRNGMLAGVTDVARFLCTIEAELVARLARAGLGNRTVELSVDAWLDRARSLRSRGRLRLGSGPSRGTISLTLPIGGLAQLAFGYLAISELEELELGHEGLRENEALALCDALFPVGQPFLQHTDRW